MPWEAAERRSCAKPRPHPRDLDGYSTSAASAWSTLGDADQQICFNVPLETGRRLKKHRSPRSGSGSGSPPGSSGGHTSPTPTFSSSSSTSASSPRLPATPTDPREVLARQYYNHTPVPSSSGCPLSPMSRLEAPAGSRPPPASPISVMLWMFLMFLKRPCRQGRLGPALDSSHDDPNACPLSFF